jgi:hypothetical protein
MQEACFRAAAVTRTFIFFKSRRFIALHLIMVSPSPGLWNLALAQCQQVEDLSHGGQ